MNISKGKVTYFNGFYFRSRTEAAWASIFRMIGAFFEYEPKTFKLPNGELYVPDFYFPELDFWVEVKCEPPNDRSINQIFELSRITKLPCFTLYGIPWFQMFSDGKVLTNFVITYFTPPDEKICIYSGKLSHGLKSMFEAISLINDMNILNFENLVIQATNLIKEENGGPRKIDEMTIQYLVNSQKWFRINDEDERLDALQKWLLESD